MVGGLNAQVAGALFVHAREMVEVWQLGCESEMLKVVEGVERRTLTDGLPVCNRQGGKTCPLREITCGLLGALSVIVSVPL